MLRILNWSSYQSYKDRRPPWIRFHRSMLDNYEYHGMSANARSLLPMLWLLASEDNDPTSGIVNITIEKISFRIRQNVKEIKASIDECVQAGFIEYIQTCNESVTKPYAIRNETVTPETETETEKNIRAFSALWDVYPRKVNKKGAFKAYEKASKVAEHETILAGAKLYAEKMAGQEERYIAHLATWLNQERWTDQPQKSTAPWHKPENRAMIPPG